MHMHMIEDENGDTVDALYFCSDSCHRAHVGDDYAGWAGCHESEYTTWCDHCGVVIPGRLFMDHKGQPCECQSANVVVNRFRSEHGEKCHHGNWIQLPMSYLNAYAEEV